MIGTAERRPRLDHRPRCARARARDHERRALAAGRHVRRVDHRAHRASASGGSPRQTRRSRISPCPPRAQALDAGRRRRHGHRPADRRHRHAGHDVSLDRRDPRRPARRGGRGRLRPLRRLHRLHVRARAGVRDARRRARAPGARRRRRRALAHPRLDRPLDAASCSATAPGAVVLEPSEEPGFLGFELGADGAGGEHLWLPGSGSRRLRGVPDRLRADERPRGVQVRDARPRLSRRSSARPRAGCAYRRRRRLRSAPGERPHHRSRSREARYPVGAGGGQRRPLRQHVVRLDPARAGRRAG